MARSDESDLRNCPRSRIGLPRVATASRGLRAIGFLPLSPRHRKSPRGALQRSHSNAAGNVTRPPSRRCRSVDGTFRRHFPAFP